MSSQNRGCWFAISRCFNSRAPAERTLYSKVSSTETIEFEDLATAEKRALEARKKKQVVTEIEREHVMNGSLNDLVEHQRRMDAERDSQLRRQEEALRREEEAYYAAKREAANKRASHSKVPISLQIEQADQSDVGFSFPVLPVPITPSTAPIPSPATTSVVVGGVSLVGRGSVGGAQVGTTLSPSESSISQQKDDDDFDQFLESVKVKQLAVTTKSAPSPEEPVLNLSDSEEEIDFGFWEKAPVPRSSNRTNDKTSETSKLSRTDNGAHEVDLGLL